MRMNYIFAGSYNSLLYACAYMSASQLLCLRPNSGVQKFDWRRVFAEKVCTRWVQIQYFASKQTRRRLLTRCRIQTRGNFHQNSERVKMVCFYCSITLESPRELKTLKICQRGLRVMCNLDLHAKLMNKDLYRYELKMQQK
jgi:hypothetical protein